jgi:hypothetical protein
MLESRTASWVASFGALVGALGCSSSSPTAAPSSCHLASNAKVTSVSLVGPMTLTGDDAGLPSSLCRRILAADCTIAIDSASCTATVTCSSDAGDVPGAVIQVTDGGSSLNVVSAVSDTRYVTEAGIDYECDYDIKAM